MTRQLVLVTWKDAWQDQENFNTAHGIAVTHAPMRVETLGWIIQDDDEGVSVVNERSTQDGSDVFRGRTFVPRGMIQSVVPYTLTRPRAAKPKPVPPESPKTST
jgi:hypothetical protein